MNRILLASVAVLGLAGAAAAQEAPQLYGNYSANVLNEYNGTALPGSDRIDLNSTAAIRNAPVQSNDDSQYQGVQQPEPSAWEIRSGR